MMRCQKEEEAENISRMSSCFSLQKGTAFALFGFKPITGLRISGTQLLSSSPVPPFLVRRSILISGLQFDTKSAQRRRLLATKTKAKSRKHRDLGRRQIPTPMTKGQRQS
jgi:hypothetical protein